MRSEVRIALGALVLVALLLAVLVDWEPRAPDAPEQDADDPAQESVSSGDVSEASDTVGEAAPEAPESSLPEGAVGEPPARPSPVVEPGDEEGAEARTPDTVEDIASLPPAVKKSPRTPPPPRPGRLPLGSGGRPPMGPTGLWEKFPPEIPTGRASLSATVLDRDGEPVPGADVYVGPPDAAGNAAVSFGDLRKVGRTGRDGKLLAERLPEGSASVAANLENLLNGPRGLDMRTAVRTALLPDQTAQVEIRLPFTTGEFGTIRGIVVDSEGTPLASASVLVDYRRVYSGKDGRFELRSIRAGEKTLGVRRSGYAPQGVPVEVVEGEVSEVEVVLVYRETGSISLRGSVVGPEGEPVPGARVYVICQSGRGGGTLRSVDADEHGLFHMDSLPDRLAEADIRIQASKQGYGAGNAVFPEGIKVPEVQVRMSARLVKLILTVRDAATGEPLTRCRFEAREKESERPVASFCSRSPTGTYERWMKAGRFEFLVEAPDHEAHRATVDVGPPGAEHRYLARLVGTGEEAREVVLTVRTVSASTQEPVERAKVEVLDPEGITAVARLEGERPGGLFVLPVPSGQWLLRVSAKGYQAVEQRIDLPETESEAEVELRLFPE